MHTRITEQLTLIHGRLPTSWTGEHSSTSQQENNGQRWQQMVIRTGLTETVVSSLGLSQMEQGEKGSEVSSYSKMAQGSPGIGQSELWLNLLFSMQTEGLPGALIWKGCMESQHILAEVQRSLNRHRSASVGLPEPRSQWEPGQLDPKDQIRRHWGLVSYAGGKVWPLMGLAYWRGHPKGLLKERALHRSSRSVMEGYSCYELTPPQTQF